jgi:Cu(I)/Ag(I) efflux system membrane fusion protein
MDLQPVYDSPAPDTAPALNLETETVHSAPFTREIRTAGRVAPDEGRTYVVSAGVDGWIRQIFADRVGVKVQRGDKLASFYSRDIAAPQQAYIYALESYERLRRAASPPADQLTLATQQLANARDTLLYIGIGEPQLAEIDRTHRESSDLDLSAPAAGLILERRVNAGQRFMRGEMLYRLADLSQVWILANLGPAETAAANSIQSAEIQIAGQAPIAARLTRAAPQFDDLGRTGKLRLDVDNPSGSLTPGMIVDVTLRLSTRAAITVHASAVVDSGSARHVFAVTPGGQFEAKPVTTGAQQGDRIEIVSGLSPGDRVVTSGAFLLDSESRLKSPTAGIIDPECGMRLTLDRARKLDRGGSVHYFCSKACERKFIARHPQ